MLRGIWYNDIYFLDKKQGSAILIFWKNVSLADIGISVTLSILFLILSNMVMNFNNWKLSWKLIIISETLITIKWVELIEKKRFTIVAFSLKDEIFIVYIIFFANSNLDIHLFCKTQLTFFFTDKTLIVISSNCINFTNMFFLKFATKLPKYIKMNNFPNNLIDGQQLPHYEHIYSLRSIKFKILKMYIKTNLANNFIWNSKLLVNTFIFFI